MPRAKGGFKTRRRHKGILKQASGFRGARGKRIRLATEAVKRAMRYSTRHRKLRKRDFRALWISRIGAATKENGISYASFMGKLLKANVAVNRKMLSEIAIHNPKGFLEIIHLIQ